MDSQKKEKTRFSKLIIIVLILILVASLLAVFSVKSKTLKVIACDVGQGDAIIVTYGSFQILTDGGLPNGKAIECLSKYIPFWDRTIEVVVNTHPQLDHYGGLIEVFKRYNVQKFITNKLDSSSQEYQVLKNQVLSRDTQVIHPSSGLAIKYDLIYLDILWPTERFISENSVKLSDDLIADNGLSEKILGTTTSELDPNDFSVVSAIHYKDFDALFTGDIGPKISKQIVEELKDDRNISWEYIKVPHHGSKNGLTEYFLEYLRPKVAVISAGKNNRYGHPHKEVLEMLDYFDVQVYRTDTSGDVVVESGGDKYFAN